MGREGGYGEAFHGSLSGMRDVKRGMSGDRTISCTLITLSTRRDLPSVVTGKGGDYLIDSD